MASIMPLGGVDRFTGPNASALSSNWTVALAQGVGYIIIYQNQGYLHTGRNANNRTSLRLNVPARRDAEIVFDWFIAPPGAGYPRVLARSQNQSLDTGSTYFFTLDPAQMQIGIMDAAYAQTVLRTKAYPGRTPGQNIRTRIACFGPSLKARSWPVGISEPTGSWDIEVTDSTWTTPGHFGFTVVNALADTEYYYLYIDNVDAFDTETEVGKTITATGVSGPTAQLVRGIARPSVANIAPSGSLARRRVLIRQYGGTITARSTVRKGIATVLAGAIAPVASMARRPLKTLGGSADLVARLRRTPDKRLDGAVLASSEVRPRSVGRVYGRPGLVVMLIRKAGDVRSRIRKG